MIDFKQKLLKTDKYHVSIQHLLIQTNFSKAYILVKTPKTIYPCNFFHKYVCCFDDFVMNIELMHDGGHISCMHSYA